MRSTTTGRASKAGAVPNLGGSEYAGRSAPSGCFTTIWMSKNSTIFSTACNCALFLFRYLSFSFVVRAESSGKLAYQSSLEKSTQSKKRSAYWCITTKVLLFPATVQKSSAHTLVWPRLKPFFRVLTGSRSASRTPQALCQRSQTVCTAALRCSPSSILIASAAAVCGRVVTSSQRLRDSLRMNTLHPMTTPRFTNWQPKNFCDKCRMVPTPSRRHMPRAAALSSKSSVRTSSP